MAAQDMLESFLRKTRRKHQVDATTQSPEIAVVVDTVLAILFARTEKTSELYALLQEDNRVVVSEIEQVLKTTGQYNALCILYQQHHEDTKLLETWAKSVTFHSFNPPLIFISRIQSSRRRMDRRGYQRPVDKHNHAFDGEERSFSTTTLGNMAHQD